MNNRLALIALTLLSTTWCLGRDCGLTFSMSDETGKPYPYRVESFKSSRGPERADLFKDLRAETLPCGTYQYELLRSDTTAEIVRRYGRSSGTVFVQDSHQVLTLYVSSSTVITPTGAISGTRPRPQTSFCEA